MTDDTRTTTAGRPRVTWAWLGLGILLLAALAWLIFAFIGMATGPQPPPVELTPTGQTGWLPTVVPPFLG